MMVISDKSQANDTATLIRLKADRGRMLEENRENLDKIQLLEQKLVDFENGRCIYDQKITFKVNGREKKDLCGQFYNMKKFDFDNTGI